MPETSSHGKQYQQSGKENHQSSARLTDSGADNAD
jgi:hypothetical protein